jgi:hypothetical protein
MDKQEAYAELVGMINQMEEIHQRAKKLAEEHGLLYKCTSYFDPIPNTEDPSRLVGSGWDAKYKDDDPHHAGQYLYDVWQTSAEAGC